MVTLGADTHKSTHTIVALDDPGRPLGDKTVPATPAGHRSAMTWAERFTERRWALEDVRHLSRRLEGDLLRAGEHVVRVPTRLMGEARRCGRERGKSDAIDARATALAATARGDPRAGSRQPRRTFVPTWPLDIGDSRAVQPGARRGRGVRPHHGVLPALEATEGEGGGPLPGRPGASVTRRDVREAGERDREALRRRAAHGGPITDDTLVVRIQFHVVA